MSDKKQVLKFHYYFVKCTEGNNLANFVVDSNCKLELLLEKLKGKNHSERTWTYNNDDDNRIILQSLSKEANGYWKISFVKVRDGALPGRLDADGDFKEIILEADEYIGEDMTIVYSPKHNIIGIQRNFYSVSASKVEDYFSYKEIENMGDGIQFKFDPIISSRSIPNDAILRSFEISCYDLDNSSLEDIIENYDTFGAKRITIKCSMGTSAKGNGLIARAKDFIDYIRVIPNCKKAQVTYRKDETSPIDKIDFLEQKLEDRIEIIYSKSNPISHERIYNTFIGVFDDRIDEISRG